MVEGERRPDTIAFDTNQNTFVVIEYKNRRNSDVVAQANTYLRDMEQNKAALVLEHSTKMNCKPLDKKLFCWKDMYAIIMAPEFGPFQISGASKNQEVEMYETRMYDNLVITVERVGGGHSMHSGPQIRDPDGSSTLCGNCFYGNLFLHLFRRFEYTPV